MVAVPGQPCDLGAVLEQCDDARESIRLKQYIFGTRGVGRQLLDFLAENARPGVDVRVLADGLGSQGLTRSDGGRALLRSGGHITMFNGGRDPLRNPIGRAHRLHRKTLISDDSQVMVGGSCYEDRMSEVRGGSVCLNSFQAGAKWFSLNNAHAADFVREPAVSRGFLVAGFRRIRTRTLRFRMRR